MVPDFSDNQRSFPDIIICTSPGLSTVPSISPKIHGLFGIRGWPGSVNRPARNRNAVYMRAAGTGSLRELFCTCVTGGLYDEIFSRHDE